MKRHLRMLSLYFQHVLNYRAKNLVWFLESALRPFLLLIFWQGAVSGRQTINNWTLNDIRSYYLYIMVASVFLMHSVELFVANKEIKNGELDTQLLHPFPYYITRFYSEIPWRFIQCIYALIALFVLKSLFHVNLAFLDVSQQLPYALIITVFAYFISYLFKIIIGFVAFWLTDIRSLFEVNDIFVLIFAGQILPIAFFPQYIQSLAFATPYPYIIYYPVLAFSGLLTTPELINIIAQQIVWIVGLIALYWITWKNGLKVFTGVGQ